MFAALGSARAAPVGVMGLGAGTLAAYALRGQRMTFFEIDRSVETFCRDERFFNDSEALK